MIALSLAFERRMILIGYSAERCSPDGRAAYHAMMHR